MSRSIVDEPELPVEQATPDQAQPSLADVAEMVFLLFEAFKDLEAKLDEFIASR